MQISADTGLRSVARALARNLVHAQASGEIHAAYLIGSRTTQECAATPGTSDIDVILVVDQCLDPLDEHRLKARILDGLASSEPAWSCHVGVRCRKAHELPAFARYLATQGYHARYARPMFQCRSVSGSLPDFERAAPTMQEYVCVLAECLWADVRSASRAAVHPRVAAYSYAKGILAYLNLLLISRGIYEPTHKSRIEHSSGVVPLEIRKHLWTAHEAKLEGGARPDRDLIVLAGLLVQIREMAVAELDLACLAHADSDFDATQFWFDRPAIPSQERVIAIGKLVCKGLASALGAPVPIDAGERQPAASCAPLAMLLEHLAAQAPSGNSHSVIHEFRVSHSAASRRDWGCLEDEMKWGPGGRGAFTGRGDCTSKREWHKW